MKALLVLVYMGMAALALVVAAYVFTWGMAMLNGLAPIF